MTRRTSRRGGITVHSTGVRAILAAAFALCMLALPFSERAEAHPLGNFTINHHSTVGFADGEARVAYVLDYAEIPTVQMKPRLDADDDGELSKAEADAHLDAELPRLVDGLSLTIGGEELPLDLRRGSAEFVPGEAGLPTLRVEADLAAELPRGWEGESGVYANGNLEDRLGWREIVVRGGPGVVVENSSVPQRSVSDELRVYPEDMLSTPLDRREAAFALAPGDGAVAEVAGGVGGGTADRLSALIPTGSLSPSIIAATLLSALLWGAAHAFTPGHGKAVVAAYLVGSRGTLFHAGLLGLTVTLTHTAGVFVLGAVTLGLSQYILPEALYPWLSVVSGFLVVAVGLSLLFARLKSSKKPDGKHHAHEHAHPAHSHHGHSHGPSSRGGLLALGVSGGLVPCPGALVLLLGAVSLGRLEFGLALVLAFSVGLALVLTGIGAIMVYASGLFERFSFETRVPRLLPVVSASAICFVGAAILFEAIRRTGVL